MTRRSGKLPRPTQLLLVCLLPIVTACSLLEPLLPPSPRSGPYTAISLNGFSDGINHWRNRYGNDYAKYTPEQIVEIADNVLLYQRDNGGWVENRDLTRVLNAEEKSAIAVEKTNATGSFDNRNVLLADRVPVGRLPADL
ncbi:MAG: hypothetical protein QM776_17035 [Rhodocyclaceae bacterium]